MMVDLLVSQLTDPFRIGLMFFLLVTALRTRHTMGMTVPLAMGVVFVAILLPLTTAAGTDASRIATIGLGILANAVLLGIFLLGWLVWEKQKR
ncbi:hypothetical protein [Rhizobium sp. CSW-27]|uniref:hypothetical protein n=1 Tax=Rhizobium sp. CSW-27 TaxID=2839985 RepID=UPI001C013F7A|nr:hypothetical protein [Rhizobium sp. CSW-27]MBT9371853.1 hypothetical protein [Rhizobium sp. CSW-27]